MRRSKYIHMRERCGHAASDGLIPLQSEQGIQPQNLLHAPVNSSHLRRQHLRLSCIPAVAENNKNGIAREQLPPIDLVEVEQRLADLGATRPARRPLREPP